MQYKNLNTFIKGVFENEGKESRIPDPFLTKCLNMDIDVTGKLTRRPGCESWEDLKVGGSVASANGIPDMGGNTGFGNRIQALFQYIDVAGVGYIVVVCDGKVYIETLESDDVIKQWSCINPNFDLKNKDSKVSTTSYLDLLFFNDVGDNVYYYDSQSYVGGGWTVLGNRFSYFAGDKIYLRDYSDFSAKTHDNDITAADHTKGANLDTFDVGGDVRHQFTVGDTITVTGSTANDGDYTINKIAMNGADTQLTVDEDLTDSTADGSIASQYRILIEDNEINSQGKAIWDGLDDITYPYICGAENITGIDQGAKTFTIAGDFSTGQIGAMLNINGSTGNDGKYTVSSVTLNAGNTDIVVDEAIPDATVDGTLSSTNLNLGFVKMTGNIDTGVYYFVLDNGKNQRADDKCQIIKFNDRLIAQDYVELDMNADGEIINFDIYDGNVYIMCEDNRIEVLDISNLSNTPLITGDVSGISAVTNSSAKKQYSISASVEGIFIYGSTLPDRSDWYQPIPMCQFTSPDSCSPVESCGWPTWDKANYPGWWWGWNWETKFWRGIMSSVHFSLFSPPVYFVKSARNGNMKYMRGIIRKVTPSLFPPTTFFTGYQLTMKPESGIESYYHLDLCTFATQITDMAFGTAKHWWSFSGGPPAQEYNYRMQYYIQEIDEVYNATSFRKSKEFDFTDAYCYYHWIFHYNKDGWYDGKRNYFQKDVANNRITRINGNVFYLYGLTYNTDIFSSKTQSKYALLIGLDFNGNLKTKTISTMNEGNKTWKYIIPLGKLSGETRDVVPLVIKDGALYSGTDMIDGVAGNNMGQYMYLNLDTFALANKSTRISCRKLLIESDDEKRWFLQGDPDDNKQRIGTSWDYGSAIFEREDYTGLLAHNSNLFFHLFVQIGDVAGEVQSDKLSPLGVPKTPQVTIGQDDTSDLVQDSIFRYQSAYEFMNENTTLLSPVSQSIYIPDMGVGNHVKVTITDLNLSNARGIPLYETADVNKIQVYRSQYDETLKIWSEPILIGTILKADIGTVTSVIDKIQSPSVNPFTDVNALKYPVNDIVLHKNRLLLINKLNEENSSVVMYSDKDMAQAIPAGNIRPIQSGDGDYLVTGRSTGDYLYLFKSSKIYGVLGDIYNGQLVDIDLKKGSRYKHLVVIFEKVCYFLNDYGIFKISGQRIEDIMQETMRNYFNKQRDDSIDFTNLAEGFADIDEEHREILFHVPQKVNGHAQTTNNLIIVYNIDHNYFRTRKYHKSVSDFAYIINLSSKDYQYIISDYDGHIYKLSQRKNDNNSAIKYIIRTKYINVGTNVVSKMYKILKIFGKYLHKIRIAYWIDGKRYAGDVGYRSTLTGRGSAFFDLWSEGSANRISIEISGETINDPPVEIEEILLGFTKAGSLR